MTAHAVRDALLASEAFRTGLRDLAAELGRSEDEVTAEAARYPDEMVTGWTRLLVDLGVRLGRFNFQRGYDPELDVDPAQVARLQERAAEPHPLVFLPSHKSNLDTLVMNVALHDTASPARTCSAGSTCRSGRWAPSSSAPAPSSSGAAPATTPSTRTRCASTSAT